MDIKMVGTFHLTDQKGAQKSVFTTEKTDLEI